MIKLLSLILILFLHVHVVVAQTIPSFEALLPLYDGNANLGDVRVQITDEKLDWIERDSIIAVLNGIIKHDTLNALYRLPERIEPSTFPLPIRFNPEDLKLETTIDLDIRITVETDIGTRDLEAERREALRPAPFGGAINYNLEQTWGDERLGGNYFSGQFNSFINVNSFVLENQTYYQSHAERKWYRGDTRLIKDFEESNIRTQAGDIYPQIQGFMIAKPLGGVNIQRNFSLNPYRLPYPTANQTFTLKSRSIVKYYVNSVLVKTEHLQAGNYSAKDIPLNNGLNTILIEATDDLGQKQFFVFKASSNINLLNEGESKFDLSYGTPFFDQEYKREYIERDGKVFSGFFQYGFSNLFSGSLYLQNQGNFSLYGTEMIQAIPIGNLTAGVARSNMGTLEGSAGSLGYQLITQGKKWFDSHTLSLRYENRSRDFKTQLGDQSTSIQNSYAANYALPLTNYLTFSIGGNYGDVRNNNLEDRYGYDVSLNFRIFNIHNLTIYGSRNRDEFGKWNDVAYAFLTFTIPEKNTYISALYDQQQKTGRLNVLNDNQNRLNTFRTMATAEYSEEHQHGELDLSYPTQYGDFGGRLRGDKYDYAKSATQGSLRLNSAFVFAHQDSETGFGISRPIPGSFVIFKPEERLRDQRIALKSTSPYTESQTGLFDEIVFSNLIAYQYRDIQLDPVFLDPGRALQKEKYILYPTYRSAHLVSLKEKGAVVITGQIINDDGTPASLKVGSVGNVPFFTNRDGQIFIEGVEAGTHKLAIEGSDDVYYLKVDQSERGLKHIGIIRLRGNE